MIGFVVREVAGWALVVLGLLAFRESWIMLTPKPIYVPEKDIVFRPGAQIFEAPAMVVIGFVIFRGGIHLLKVSVAARAAQKANRELEEAMKRPRLPLPKPSPVRK